MGKGYQAHETYAANFQMYLSLIRTSITVGFIIQILFLWFVWQGTTKELLKLKLGYTGINVNQNMINNYLFSLETIFNLPERSVFLNDSNMQRIFGRQSEVPISVYRNRLDLFTNKAFFRAKNHLIRNFKFSFWAYLISILIIIYFISASRKMSKDKFVRGVELMPLKDLNQKLEMEVHKEKITNLKIGETIIPRKMEPYHILILGAIGSGKSVLLNQFLRQINDRKIKDNLNDKAIVYDMKGEFVAKQMNENDKIFSPFDKRTVHWSFFNEIENYPDFDIVASSLYIPEKKEDGYWFNCAKDVFRSGLIWLKFNNQTKNEDIVSFFAKPLKEIIAAFECLGEAERAAIRHIDKTDSNMSASIISILQERIQFFRYLTDIDGDFSFRKYVRDENINHNLYLLNIEQYSDIFKPLMTFAVDTIIRETISLADNRDRRIFFVIDELGSLYKLESLIKLLTIGRSKGGSLICSNQDMGRIKDTYGEAISSTFYNGFNTNFLLRINEPKTANFISQALGERQVIKKVESRQMSPSDWGDRTSISDQEKTERIILGTEFQNFKDFEAVLKVSNFGISKITIPKIFYPEVNSYYAQKEFEIKNEISEPVAEDNEIIVSPDLNKI